jgi:hypothetical protein
MAARAQVALQKSQAEVLEGLEQQGDLVFA